MSALAAVVAGAIVAGAVVAASIVWAARAIVAEIRVARQAAQSARILKLLDTFAPAIAATEQDPRAFLVWMPLARAARALFADDFAQLDRAMGAAFPFPPERVQAAHAKWTADWLAWERSHDAEYKRRAAEAAHELAAADATIARGRLDAIEREKLDSYQRRYEEYARIAKALQTLAR